MTMRKILVANRGEIARRIFRTAHAMGMTCVAVYSDADADAAHVAEAEVAVRLPGIRSADTYLNGEAIIAAAQATGADAIHPGYGFLSENPDFAQAVIDAGLIWIGPNPDSIRQMALKVEAKEIAAAAGVPLAPGAVLPESLTPAELTETCAGVGYPLLIKASAGGGGKGMRLVDTPDHLHDAVAAARGEAARSFANATVFAEAYLADARHIEVQVFGDTMGNVVHLFERECSIQRRHQKIVEESPSIGISEVVRTQLHDSAVRLAEHIGYVGAGTVEFMVRGDDVAFLEMNTRLQVEHPVTEATVGVDLVAWQIAVARGERLPMRQEDIAQHGHAIEVRLYAEDPARDDLPATGRIACMDTDPSLIGISTLRIDSGFESGDVISPFYDPMLAKVIASGQSRGEAAARLALGLRRMRIHGPVTNRDLLVAILDSAPFVAGETTTAFLEHHPHLRHPNIDAAVVQRHAIAAALAPALTSESIPGVPSGWRNVPAVPETRIFIERSEDVEMPVHYLHDRDGWRVGVGDETDVTGLTSAGITLRSTVDGTLLDLEIDGVRSHLHVSSDGEEVFVDDGLHATAWTPVSRFPDQAGGADGHDPQAPVPGTVTGIHVGVGDRVDAGQLLVTLEAMKMEHRLTASSAGLVQAVLVAVGDSVDAHQILVRVEDDS
jgi:acetyl/propionyl-CoA carboxylase alpha subunit